MVLNGWSADITLWRSAERIIARVCHAKARYTPGDTVVLEYHAPHRVARWRAMFGLAAEAYPTERTHMVVVATNSDGVVDLQDLNSWLKEVTV